MYQKSEAEQTAIYWEMEYYRGKVEWAQTENSVCSGRIERLNTAISGLTAVIDDLKTRRTAVKKLPFRANKWTGNNAENYFDCCDSCGGIYEEYSACITLLEVRLSDYQAELTHQYSYQSLVQGILNDNWTPYTDAKYRYENYWWS